jgi:hypothetical protein
MGVWGESKAAVLEVVIVFEGKSRHSKEIIVA